MRLAIARHHADRLVYKEVRRQGAPDKPLGLGALLASRALLVKDQA